ncbi:MAG: SDR family oxidoreductase [Hyphomicrobium sp.]
MLMSVVDLAVAGQVFPELAGARVLITGLTTAAGVDMARAFADHKAHLVVQTVEDGPEMTALGAVLTQSSAALQVFSTPIATNEDAVRLTQSAAQEFGGLDAVVNIIEFSERDFEGCHSLAEIETLIARRLGPAMFVTRVAANRMRLTMTEGSILNVVRCPVPADGAEQALIGVIRTALAAMTRGEAREWAGEVIRINAIGPRGLPGDDTAGAVLTSEPDMAHLALHLASRKGRPLTGYVFDAEGAARRRC